MRRFPVTTLVFGNMIISIYSEPDRRLPRLAFLVARLRRQLSRSVALLDITTATPPVRASGLPIPVETVSGVPVVRACGSVEVELSRMAPLYKDIVIDSDNLSSPAGISGLVAARTAVIALYPHSMQDLADRSRLIARIERAWLFNPLLQVLLLPVCFGAVPAPAHIEALNSFAGKVPCIRLAKDCIRDLHELGKSLGGTPGNRAGHESLSLCDEIFTVQA